MADSRRIADLACFAWSAGSATLSVTGKKPIRAVTTQLSTCCDRKSTVFCISLRRIGRNCTQSPRRRWLAGFCRRHRRSDRAHQQKNSLPINAKFGPDPARGSQRTSMNALDRMIDRRATPPSCTAVVHQILPRDKDASILGEGCAGLARRQTGWDHSLPPVLGRLLHQFVRI
jgi:hypothetical protein